MAKITLADGMVIEGTAEELRELAKAFGEVAEATEKEVPEFKVGDYAKITGAGDKPPYNSHKFPIGSIVKVDEVGDNECGDRFLGKHIDGVGHGWWVLNEYAVKATVEEVADALGEVAEADTEEVQAAEETPEESLVGKYVVFHQPKGTIKVGEYYEITGIIKDGGKTYAEYIIDGDYEGNVAYPPSESLFKYEIADEKPSVQAAPEPAEEDMEETIKAGDLIRFTENFFGVKEGEIVEVVTGADIVGDIQYRDRDGEIWNALPKRFELVAKKADRRDLADRKDV